MKATLMSLKEYQDVLIRIAELDRLLSNIPPEIENMEVEWKAAQKRIEELSTKKEELDSRQKEQQSALTEAKDKESKFEKDLHDVTNNKEYHAVLKEIDMAKKLVNSVQDDISSRNKELDEIKAKIEENTNLESELKTSYDAAMANHNDSLAEYKTERDQKLKIRDSLAGKVPERLMRQFERIASRRNGIGLSDCIGAICRACNVRVRQNIVDELRKYQRIITCESCKRILYFADGDE